MGSGIIVVVSKDGRPLKDQEVNIDWNWAGLGTGANRSTSNNLGEAIFNGNPPFSQGKGQIKGPIGEFANFSVGSDAYGNFERRQVQVSWNPVGSASATIGSFAESTTRAITQVGILGAVIGIIALIGYAIYKKSMVGQALSRVRNIF
jgi:hypothetical protein